MCTTLNNNLNEQVFFFTVQHCLFSWLVKPVSLLLIGECYDLSFFLIGLLLTCLLIISEIFCL